MEPNPPQDLCTSMPPSKSFIQLAKLVKLVKLGHYKLKAWNSCQTKWHYIKEAWQSPISLTLFFLALFLALSVPHQVLLEGNGAAKQLKPITTATTGKEPRKKSWQVSGSNKLLVVVITKCKINPHLLPMVTCQWLNPLLTNLGTNTSDTTDIACLSCFACLSPAKATAIPSAIRTAAEPLQKIRSICSGMTGLVTCVTCICPNLSMLRKGLTRSHLRHMTEPVASESFASQKEISSHCGSLPFFLCWNMAFSLIILWQVSCVSAALVALPLRLSNLLSVSFFANCRLLEHATAWTVQLHLPQLQARLPCCMGWMMMQVLGSNTVGDHCFAVQNTKSCIWMYLMYLRKRPPRNSSGATKPWLAARPEQQPAGTSQVAPSV